MCEIFNLKLYNNVCNVQWEPLGGDFDFDFGWNFFGKIVFSLK